MRTPQTLLTPLGRRYPAISIPGNIQARGIVIDNPSGAWLHLRPTDDFIPPYTMGWSRPLPGLTAVDISYESPAGQVQTLQGDIPSLVLDTESVAADAGSSSGTPFIQQFTPTLFAPASGSVVLPGDTGGSSVQIAGVANKRIRLLGISLAYAGQGNSTTGASINNPGFGFAAKCMESPIHITIFQADGLTNPQIWGAVLDRFHVSDGIDYPSGFDVAVGASVSRSVDARGFATTFYDCVMEYQLI